MEKDLKRLDRPTIKRVLGKIETHLAKDPKGLGKAFGGEFRGLWRYRIGDFRVIYKIAEQEILVVVARVGHR